MFDSGTQRKVIERVAGDGIMPGGPLPDEATGPGTDALWRTFVGLSYELQALGISPGALCDATNEVAAQTAQIESDRHREGAQVEA